MPDASDSRTLAQKVYNRLMKEIDEDLTLENLPNLDKKYAGESPEDREKRLARYQESYKKFDQAMQQFLADVHAEARQLRAEKRGKKEAEQRAADLESLGDLLE